MTSLRCVIVFAAVLATLDDTLGQTSLPMMPQSPAATCTVIGDVRNLQPISLPSTRMTVRQAVLAAEPLSDPVTVTVIRRGQESPAWSQLLSVSAPDSEEIVVDGDVLVVQAMSPTSQRMGNAVLRTESGNLVVALQDQSVAVGDILEQTGIPFSKDHKVKVTSRFQGRSTVRQPDLYTVVLHGDVVTLVREQTKIQGFGRMVPAFSEWTGANSGTVAAQPSTSQSVVDAPQPVAPQEVPDVRVESLMLALPADSASMEAETDLPADHSEFSGISEKPVLNVQPVSTSAPFDPAELEVAPEPPAEVTDSESVIAVDTEQQSGSLWNSIFAGAVLLSGILILVAAFRADDVEVGSSAAVVARESSLSTERRSAEMRIQASRPEVQHVSAEPEPAEMTAETPILETAEPPEAHTNRVSALDPIGPVRWFGSDWKQGDNSGKSDAPPAERQGLLTAAAELPAASREVASKSEESVTSPARDVMDLSDAAGVSASVNVPDSVNVSGSLGTPANSEPESKVSTGELPAERQPMSDLQPLEDLIRNRLPVDLCEAALPLRIALFGHAAGPRRLRVDAAHPVLTGPHTGRKSERVSEADGMSVAEQDNASLDKALSRLQERTTT